MTVRENTQRFTTKIADIFLDNGILFVNCHENLNVGLGELQELLPVMDEICDGEKYPILLNTGKNNKISTNGRQFIADKFKKYRTAEAIVCDSFYHRLLAPLYITINKPGNPVKVFLNDEEALEWLKENHLAA